MHPDDGEGEEQRAAPPRRLGEEVQPEAQQAVRPELEHRRGEDHRPRGRRLGVGVGQPRVKGEDRHLDGEGDGEGEEQPASRGRRELGLLGEHDEIERHLAHPVVGGEERRGDDADEHERRAEHREQEELQRRVLTVVVAPPADQEVHRHEHDLEEDEEDEEVEAEEAAHQPGLQQEQPGEVRLLAVVRVGTEDRQREQQARQHDEEQGDAVDPEVPRDPPLLDPGVLRHELEAGVGGVELDEQPHAESSREDTGQQPDELDQLGPPATDEGHGERAGDGRQDQRREDGEARGH